MSKSARPTTRAVLAAGSAMLLMPAGIASAETLNAALARIVGAEVEIQGYVGTGLEIGDNEAMFFRDGDETIYPVVLDAGRDVRKTLADCKFAIFGGGTPCAFTGKAEIQTDGSRIRLSIYEATEIGKPAKLP